MKVLIVPSWYPNESSPTGGIFIAQQARGLARMGVEVAVLYVGGATERHPVRVEMEDGVLTARATVYVPPPQPTFIRRKIAGVCYRMSTVVDRLATLRVAFKALEGTGFRPDVIHVHALWPAGIVGAVLAVHYRVSMVVTEHSEEYLPASERGFVNRPWLLRCLVRPLARRARVYVAVSKYLQGVLADLGIHDDIRVVPNIVPPLPVTPYATGDISQLVHVSHLTPVKNITLLLDSIALVASRRQDFRLVLVGNVNQAIDIYRDYAAEIGVSNLVHFTGLIPPGDVPSMIAGSAFGVLSSVNETFSVFAAELLMSGRPVVTTDCGGPAGFVAPEVGRIVPNHDPQALADGISWMLDNYRTFSPEMLHAYAEARFSEQAVVPQLMEIYGEVSRPATPRRKSTSHD